MKKFLLTFLSVIIFFFSSCKKKQTVDDQLLVPKKIVEYDSSSRSVTLVGLSELIGSVLTQLDDDFARTRSSIIDFEKTFEYLSGYPQLIDRVIYYDDVIANYYYADLSNGILDSIVYYENGYRDDVTYYTYENGKVKKIETIDDSTGDAEIIEVLSYNGDYPQSVRYSFDTNVVLNGTVSYAGGNVSEINLSGQVNNYNLAIRTTFSYDDAPNYMTNVLTKEDIFKNKNNVTNQTVSITVNSIPYSTQSVQYSYQYNDKNYPETYVKTENDGSSTETYNGQIEYMTVN